MEYFYIEITLELVGAEEKITNHTVTMDEQMNNGGHLEGWVEKQANWLKRKLK